MTMKSAARGIALFAFACFSISAGSAQEMPRAASLPAIPDGFRKLLTATDTVPAFKQLDALDGNKAGAAAVIRYASTADSTTNPCELLIYRVEGSGFTLIDKSHKAVDCTHIDFPKRAGELDLNDNLTVKPKEVSYFNERERGGQTYVFAYSTEKSAWHLVRATSVYTQPGDDKVDVIELSANYPSDVGWISMASFDPDRIADAMSKHRIIH